MPDAPLTDPLNDDDALGVVATTYRPEFGEPPERLRADSRVSRPDEAPPGWKPDKDNPRGWPGEHPGRTRARIRHELEVQLWDAWVAGQARDRQEAQRAAARTEPAAPAPYREPAAAPVVGRLPVAYDDLPARPDARVGSVHRNFRIPGEVDRVLAELAQRDFTSTSGEIVTCILFRDRMLNRGGPGTGRMWALVDDGVELPPGAFRVLVEMT